MGLDDNVCTCDTADYAHTCPFAEDVNGDSESLCTCCELCEYNCAMDI